jgi:thiol:disulfide interchange protein DsbD
MPDFFARALLAALFAVGAAPALAQDEFLDPEVAFVLSVEQQADAATLHWDIAEGYKLYRDKFVIASDGLDATAIAMPPAESHFDENFGEDMAIYTAPLSLVVPLPALRAAQLLSITYQGCAEAGLCYPPITKRYELVPGARGPLALQGTSDLFSAPAEATQTGSVMAAATSAAALAAPAQDEISLATRMLQSRNLWTIAGGFLVFGLLLSFTPCVLPMVPILSSIIVGMDKHGQNSRLHGLRLSLAYCLGMALVYTAMGVAAGLLGEGLAAYLQAPWLLLSFATLLVLFSLSMFDVYQLELPQGLQARLNTVSGGLQGGQMASVFVLGAVSSLIVGPCVAAPLAGALVYISQTGDVVLGGTALFAMAMGMSVPLLLTGLSAGSLLPRAGAWMVHVKELFGLLLLAVAIWMVTPVLPVAVIMLLWGALALLSAMYLGLFDRAAASPPATFRARVSAMLAVLLLVIGLAQIVGAVSGARSPLQPLAHFGGTSPDAVATSAVKFRRIATLAELEQIRATATRPVMLDFYADWCVACKEMERFTFSDSQVAAAMAGFELLQVDVTANNADDRALMKAYSLFGPPAILLFDPAAPSTAPARVIGFTPAPAFLDALSPLLL